MEINKKLKNNLIAVCVIKSICTIIPSILLVGCGILILFSVGFGNLLMGVGGLGSDFTDLFGADIFMLYIIPIVYFIVLVKAFATSCMEDAKKIRISIIIAFLEEIICVVVSGIGFMYIGTTDRFFVTLQVLFLVSAVISLILNIRNIILVNKLVYLEN